MSCAPCHINCPSVSADGISATPKHLTKERSPTRMMFSLPLLFLVAKSPSFALPWLEIENRRSSCPLSPNPVQPFLKQCLKEVRNERNSGVLKMLLYCCTRNEGRITTNAGQVASRKAAPEVPAAVKTYGWVLGTGWLSRFRKFPRPPRW
jgi:hypothetical protein